MIKKMVFLLFLASSVLAQEKRNEFFAFHNMISDDTTFTTYEGQVGYIQSVGFDGMSISYKDDLVSLKSAFEEFDFKIAMYYVGVDIDEPSISPELKTSIKSLKGSKTTLGIAFRSEKYREPNEEGNNQVIKKLQEISSLAKKSKLDVAIYPHYEFYVQTHTHAYNLASEIGKINVGYAFNLCHWLATSGIEERNTLRVELQKTFGKIKFVSINGANRVVSQKANVWDDYIQPLGEGSFDTFELFEFLINRLKYQGPIGVQCYGLKGDKMQMAEDTMLIWKSYWARLQQSDY